MGGQEIDKTTKGAETKSPQDSPATLIPNGVTASTLGDMTTHEEKVSLGEFDATFGMTADKNRGIFPNDSESSVFGLNRVKVDFNQNYLSRASQLNLNEPWSVTPSPFMSRLQESLQVRQGSAWAQTLAELGIEPVEAMVFLTPGQEWGYLTLANGETKYQIAGGLESPMRISVANSQALQEFVGWLHTGAQLNSLSVVTDGTRAKFEPVIMFDSAMGQSITVGNSMDSLLERISGHAPKYNHMLSGTGINLGDLGLPESAFSLNSFEIGRSLATEVKLRDSFGREFSLLLATETGRNLVGFRGLANNSFFGKAAAHGMMIQESNQFGGSDHSFVGGIKIQKELSKSSYTLDLTGFASSTDSPVPGLSRSNLMSSDWDAGATLRFTFTR
jgi:hypothetical protein